MTEQMHRLETRFRGRLLAALWDEGGVLEQLFYHSENEYLVVHHNVLDGPAWLDDGRGNGHTVEDVRRYWPELADAAGLD